MTKAVLHPQTQQHITHFTANPSHALLLVGPHGIGKTYLAEAIVAQVLGLQADELHQHPYLLTIQPNGTSISIETIRELQKFLQLKTLGSGQPIRRAVII